MNVDQSYYGTLKNNFKLNFPSFARFDWRCDEYGDVERDYKDELIAIYNRKVRSELEALPSNEADQATVAQKAIQMFRERLETEKGKPQNLVGWRYSDVFFKLSEEEQARFARALAHLVNEEKELTARIEEFVSTHQALCGEHGESLSHAASRSVTTFYLFLHHPDKYFFIKTTEVDTFLRKFTGEKLRSGLFSAETYEPVLTAANLLKTMLEADGLAPRDMVDVQSFIWMGLRTPEVTEANFTDEKDVKQMDKKTNTQMLNMILYGPPGTGKTYHSINKALAILDPAFYEANFNDRNLLKLRFDQLKERGRIAFVTFHQSFSYEDFVEGLRANADDTGQVNYEIEDGIFKRICDTARNCDVVKSVEPISLIGRKFWKMSLGNTQGEDAYVYDDCIEEGVIRLGYGYEQDYKNAGNKHAVRDVHLKAGLKPEDISYSIQVTDYFVNVMNQGDFIIISDGNHKFRAIGEVISDYYKDKQREDGYCQTRKVRWLRTYSPSLPVDQLIDKNFTQQTLYQFGKGTFKPERLLDLLGSQKDTTVSFPFQVGENFNDYSVKAITPDILRLTKPNGSIVSFDMELINELAALVRSGQITINNIKQKQVFDRVPELTLEKYLIHCYNNILPLLIERLTNGQSQSTSSRTLPHNNAYVLIIDEINRGNIANIFGELITLIETSKRLGQPEALEVTLPYSKQRFSVPDNLYLIGTMNTADRSLVHMDTALRRRFAFEPMMPNEELLEDLPLIDGIDIAKMLRALNERITVLYDREHTLGHSFFLPLRELSQPSISDLASIFNRQILPLLEEYFFEDWSKIRLVLNDERKVPNAQIIKPVFNSDKISSLFGNDSQVALSEELYQRSDEALFNPAAYVGIYDSSVS